MKFLRFESLVFLVFLTACASSIPITPSAPVPSTSQSYPAPSTLPAQSQPTGYPAPATITSEAVTLTYQNFEIVPPQLTVKAGTLATFLVKDGTHQPYTSDPAPAFDSGAPLSAGATYQFTFENPGTFTLSCRLHDQMKATLIVVP